MSVDLHYASDVTLHYAYQSVEACSFDIVGSQLVSHRRVSMVDTVNN